MGGFTIQYIGVFDYYELYYFCIKWMEGKKMGIMHNLYKDKPDGPGIREKEVKLEGKTKIDEYHGWTVNFVINVFNGADLLIDMPDGTKRQMIRGKLMITVKDTIKQDFQGQFKKGFWAKMKVFMDKMRKEDYGATIYGPLGMELTNLDKELKKLLHMDTAQGSY